MEHPLASVTSTVYVPAVNPFALALLPPEGCQLKLYGPVPPVASAVAVPLDAPQFVDVVVTATLNPVTVMQNANVCDPAYGQASSLTVTVKHQGVELISAAVGVHENVPVGNGPPVVVKLAAGIPLFQVMETFCPGSISYEKMLKVSGDPAHAFTLYTLVLFIPVM